jgi:hypothetical protein
MTLVLHIHIDIPPGNYGEPHYWIFYCAGCMNIPPRIGLLFQVILSTLKLSKIVEKGRNYAKN